MKLLLVPLAVMTLIAFMVMMGFPDTAGDYTSTVYGYYKGQDEQGTLLTLNSYDGDPICYYDCSPIGVFEGAVIMYESNGYPPQEAAWSNATGYYPLYYDTSHMEPVFWADLTPLGSFSRPTERADAQMWSWGGALGVIGLVSLLRFFGALAGIKFFGSGEGDVSVKFLLVGTFFITIWAVLTGIAYPIFLDSESWIIYIIYTVLTLVYSVGIIQMVGGIAD